MNLIADVMRASMSEPMGCALIGMTIGVLIAMLIPNRVYDLLRRSI